MTQKKSGKEKVLSPDTTKDVVATPKGAWDEPILGVVIKDFGNYRVVVARSTVEEMKGRIVYAVINNIYGVIEEECSVLPQALLHAGQFNKEMTNDAWQERLNPTGMMVPTGPMVVDPRRH